MYDLSYYISTSRKCFVDIIDNMRKLSGKDFRMEKNKAVFPPDIAEGRFEFYELKDSLSLMIIDFTLYKQLFNFSREQVRSNDYYVLYIGMDNVPFQVETNEHNLVDVGSNLKNAIFFSSTANAVHVLSNEEGHRRRIILIFTRSLLFKYFDRYSINVSVKQLEDFVNDVPMQFPAELDLNSLHVAEDILSAQLPSFISPLYYAGDAMRLLALFLNNIAQANQQEEDYKFSDIGRIMSLVDGIDVVQSEVPSLEQAAENCLMSKTKFVKLFKVIYKLSYGDYFLEKKLIRAAELLRQGMQVSDVGYRIGYSNMGHFAAAFKKYYKISPKQYQLSQQTATDN